MGHILTEVTRAASVVGAVVHEISPSEASELRIEVAAKFAGGGEFWWLWERLTDYVAVHDREAWVWIGEFVGSNPAILMFNQADEPAVLKLPNGLELVPILAESYHFEFYVTNHAMDYLICFNHHDVLCGAGAMADWLERKLEAHRRPDGTYPWPAAISRSAR